MADISRYRGGAAKKRNGGKQIAGSRQQTRTNARAEDTRRANPASNMEQNENTRPRRRLDLDTGSFVEEIPPQYQERARELVEPKIRTGGWEAELDDDRVRVRRRFASGGAIEPLRGDFIEFGADGRKRRVTAAELNRPRKPPKRK